MAPLNTNDARLLENSTSPDGDIASAPRRTRRLPAPSSRVAYSLGMAMVCAVAAVELVTGGVPATAATEERSSIAVADALGISSAELEAPVPEDAQLLEQLAASRAERDGAQAAAAESQAQAEQAAAAARAEAEAKAAAEAAAAAAAAAEAAAQAEAEARAAAATAVSVIATIRNSSGPIKAVAQEAANKVVSNVPGAADITIGGTRASAADPGGHPSGLALDYMCTGALGDAIAEYHIAHWDELGVEYIIWEQRILQSPGGSWSMMEDRGGATANHYDHVHVNYRG